MGLMVLSKEKGSVERDRVWTWELMEIHYLAVFTRAIWNGLSVVNISANDVYIKTCKPAGHWSMRCSSAS